jgi:uncharacterized protein (DUF305 family)
MTPNSSARRDEAGADVTDETTHVPAYRPTAIAAIAVLLLGVFVAGVLVAGLPPGDASPEAGFARDMGVHHTQAVEMAEIARDRTSDPEVRYLAIDIALGQQAQIGQMQGWLAVWGLPATGVEPAMAWMGHRMTIGALLPGMATVDELALLRDVPSDKVDAMFLQLMIRHHRGGVDMAEGVLTRTRRPEVRRLGQAIVNGQLAEIEAMSDLLRRKGAAVPSEISSNTGMATMGHTMAAPLVRIDAAVFRDLILSAPIGMATFALAWLVADAMRRRPEGPAGLDTCHGRSEGTSTLAVGGLALGAVLHLGLWPTYALGQAGTDVLFGAEALAMAAVGGAMLASSDARAHAAGAALALLAVATFVVLRPGPLLTGMTATPLDGVELIALGVDLIALASCAMVWLSRPAHRHDVGIDSFSGVR